MFAVDFRPMIIIIVIIITIILPGRLTARAPNHRAKGPNADRGHGDDALPRDTSTHAHRTENTRAARLTHTTVRTVTLLPRRKLKVTHVMATELRWWATEEAQRRKPSALHHHGVSASDERAAPERGGHYRQSMVTDSRKGARSVWSWIRYDRHPAQCPRSCIQLDTSPPLSRRLGATRVRKAPQMRTRR
jgi:hypothetical protein